MLGYVHLTAGRPVLERRAAAGMTYWALEGDLDGGLFPGRRLRRWIGRLERCGVSHAALPPGREGDFAPLRPVLPDGLRLALLPQLLDALAPAGDTALLLAGGFAVAGAAVSLARIRLPLPEGLKRIKNEK